MFRERIDRSFCQRHAPHARWIALALGLAPAVSHALEPDKVFEKVSPSVWTVRALDAQGKPIASGSAVVIGNGRLITNCHVLRQSRAIQIRQDNVSYDATLEFPDPERDLCQISVRNFRAPSVTIAPAGSLRVGHRVYAIGSPRGLELTLSDGLVSSLRAGNESAPLIQTTAPISPGSSGGGLFDSEGRLVGITSLQRRDGQNLNFAVPAEWIADVPERGQAALDKRREATVAVAVVTSGPTAAPSEFPKQITGEDFVKFFQTYRSLRGESGAGRPLRLELRGRYVDGYTEPNSNMPILPHGITASVRGRQDLRLATNQVCLDFMVSPNTFWLGHSGCYELEQASATEYRLRPTKGETDFKFALAR